MNSIFMNINYIDTSNALWYNISIIKERCICYEQGRAIHRKTK